MAKNISDYVVLERKIRDVTAKFCIVGLGYVGLPLVVAFAKKGYFVYGLDTSASRVQKLKNGEEYIVDVPAKDTLALIKSKKFLPTTDEKVLADADVVIICVPTPLRKVKLPDVSYVVSSAKTILKYLHRQLIILESTSYTTTTREVLLPVLSASGLRSEKDFFVCFSPERINPGDAQFTITDIPKLVGGISAASTELARQVYSQIFKRVFPVSSPEVAETSKLLENTFRLVNIALINEFAMVCHKLGISIWEVIEAARTKPFGFMPFYPGPGIGGHCIPCDPVYLSWKAKKMGFKTRMIDLAAQVNRYMPGYCVRRVEELLRAQSKRMAGARVLVMGVAYKKDVKDLRESPALDIIEELLRLRCICEYHDPLFPYLKIGDLDMKSKALSAQALARYDCVIIATDHTAFPYSLIQKNARLIFDTRQVYKKRHANVVTL